MSTIVQAHTAVAFRAPPETLLVAAPEDERNQWEEEQHQHKQGIFANNLGGLPPHETCFASCRPRSDSYTGPLLSSILPSTQTALLVTLDRTYCLEPEFPAPENIGTDEVIIRSRAVGLNHIDWKSVEFNFCLPDLPWITGREMAGVVERVGSNVTKLKRGDAVWTSTYYKDRRAGCFQELVVVPQHTAFLLPPCLNFPAAACLGVGGLTAAMALWRWLGVPMDLASTSFETTSQPTSQPTSNPKEVILVWGGSTVTGQFAIQIAAQAGLEVIAVCSDSTADLVSGLGATFVVTYTAKTDFHIIGEILCLARGRLTKAIDLVGEKTARLVLQVIAACGTPIDFAPLAFMSSKDPVPANAIVKSVEMKQFVLDDDSEKYGAKLNDMIEQKTLKVPKLRLLHGGLGAVEQGLKRIKDGDLAGEKLVVLM